MKKCVDEEINRWKNSGQKAVIQEHVDKKMHTQKFKQKSTDGKCND